MCFPAPRNPSCVTDLNCSPLPGVSSHFSRGQVQSKPCRAATWFPRPCQAARSCLPGQGSPKAGSEGRAETLCTSGWLLQVLRNGIPPDTDLAGGAEKAKATEAQRNQAENHSQEKNWAKHHPGCALNFSARRSYVQSSIQAAFSAVPQLGSCDMVLPKILLEASGSPCKEESQKFTFGLTKILTAEN